MFHLQKPEWLKLRSVSDRGTALQALLRSCTGVTGEKSSPWPPHPTALSCFEGLSLCHQGQPLVATQASKATRAGMVNRALVAPICPCMLSSLQSHPSFALGLALALPATLECSSNQSHPRYQPLCVQRHQTRMLRPLAEEQGEMGTCMPQSRPLTPCML